MAEARGEAADSAEVVAEAGSEVLAGDRLAEAARAVAGEMHAKDSRVTRSEF